MAMAVVKIKEVAARAGVSPATVSRVLNGSAGVSAENQAKVRAAVAALGYRPNRVARNLRRRQVEMIGIVITDIANPHFYEMVRVVEARAFRRGYRVLLCNIADSAEKQRAYLDILAAERVRGVILAGIDPHDDEIRQVLDLGIPIVAYDRAVDDPRADAVLVDNFDGGRRATEHLLAAGHERIGFVAGLNSLQIAADRQAGYEAAMRVAGREPRSASGNFRPEGGYRAANILLAAPNPVTALVVAGNMMTIGVVEALRGRGVRVPDDVAIVALDDPFWAALVDPPLTALAQPVSRMAERAGDLLFDRIDGMEGPARHVIFTFELRVRASSGMAVRSPS